MKSRSQRLVLIIAAAIWVSVLAAACAGSRPALNWTFWKDLKVSISTVDHPAIAASYRQSAQDYRRIAQEHERMKAEYAEYDNDAAVVMQAHCDRLIEKHRSLAEEMEAMAKEHEKLAAKEREHSTQPESETPYGQFHGLKILEF